MARKTSIKTRAPVVIVPTITSNPRKAILDLPTEVLLEIYKRVFAGAQISITVEITNGELMIKRMIDALTELYTAILQMSSKVHAKAFPIMAEAINLNITFNAVQFWTSQGMRWNDLDLGALASCTHAPPFFSRIMPFVIVIIITYSNDNGMGSCFNPTAIPKLKVFCLVETANLTRMHFPGSNQLCLSNPKGLQRRLFEHMRERIVHSEHVQELRNIMDGQNRKFQIVYHTTLDFACRQRDCGAALDTCNCLHERVPRTWLESDEYPTFGCTAPYVLSLTANIYWQEFKLELGEEQQELIDRCFIFESVPYDFYEEILAKEGNLGT